MKVCIALAITGLAVSLVPTSAVAADSGSEATVAIRTIDFRGRPPFDRSVERLPVSDVARMELAGDADAFTVVRSVDFRGRPPFRRHAERVEVVDSARFEIVAQEDSANARPRASGGLKRHR